MEKITTKEEGNLAKSGKDHTNPNLECYIFIVPSDKQHLDTLERITLKNTWSFKVLRRQAIVETLRTKICMVIGRRDVVASVSMLALGSTMSSATSSTTLRCCALGYAGWGYADVD